MYAFSFFCHLCKKERRKQQTRCAKGKEVVLGIDVGPLSSHDVEILGAREPCEYYVQVGVYRQSCQVVVGIGDYRSGS